VNASPVIWPGTWLLGRLVRDADNVTDPRVRHAYVRLECWVSIVGNVLLGTVKVVLGWLAGSIALTADAFHTYGDMLSSVVLLVSMRVAVAPPDRKHPHGHGRAEMLGTLGLAALLLVTAVEFAHPAVDHLFAPDPRPLGLGWTMVPVLLVFWAVKEWMARFSEALGRRIGADSLAADAQHHRSDALATLLVVFSFVASELHCPRLDGLFGLGVAGFIGWAGVGLARDMMSQLMGEAPSEQLVDGILAAAASVRGVRGVHGIDVHDYGPRKMVSLHIEVASRTPTGASHQVATAVEEALHRRLGVSAVVHVDLSDEPPVDARAVEVERVLAGLMETEPAVTGFHAVHVTSSNRQLSIDLHLTVAPDATVEEAHRIEHGLAGRLREQIGVGKVSVHCEPARNARRRRAEGWARTRPQTPRPTSG
jgi:cation diffusion facilitator family transporter